MNLDLLVPDIGDFENVEIIEVLVKKGDKINKNDPVVTLESDKSSVEVPSNYEGTVENINVKIGDKVSVKPGYARNYLFPNDMALRENKKNIEHYDKIKDEIKIKDTGY